MNCTTDSTSTSKIHFQHHAQSFSYWQKYIPSLWVIILTIVENLISFHCHWCWKYQHFQQNNYQNGLNIVPIFQLSYQFYHRLILRLITHQHTRKRRRNKLLCAKSKECSKNQLFFHISQHKQESVTTFLFWVNFLIRSIKQ